MCLVPLRPGLRRPGATWLPEQQDTTSAPDYRWPFCIRRFCYDRLTSLLKTLEVSNTDDLLPLSLVADFATLVGTYARGFAIIIEPYDERLPHIPDPVLQLRCVAPCSWTAAGSGC